jgi:hypothetical protein
MRTTVTTFVALLAAMALVASGCGSSDEGSSGTPAAQTENGKTAEREEEGEHATTPEDAVEHLREVRNLLANALAQYREGDATEADKIVGDAYLEEFEHVEELLGERDRELMEDLEHTISTELRDKIKAGAPIAEVQALVEHINDDLFKAEEVLKA